MFQLSLKNKKTISSCNVIVCKHTSTDRQSILNHVKIFTSNILSRNWYNPDHQGKTGPLKKNTFVCQITEALVIGSLCFHWQQMFLTLILENIFSVLSPLPSSSRVFQLFRVNCMHFKKKKKKILTHSFPFSHKGRKEEQRAKVSMTSTSDWTKETQRTLKKCFRY